MLKRWHLPIFCVAVILGLLVAFQFKIQQQVNELKQTAAERNVALLEVLSKAETERNRLEAEIDSLRKQITTYEKMAESQQVITTGISAELDTYRLMTGSTRVGGPGIVVTLDEKDAFDKIASSDLQDLLNILRYAGAEAISVNGQRIVVSTAIHEAGNNMLINKTPVNRVDGAAYEIKAIGDPPTLSQLFRITNGQVGKLADLKGIKVNIAEMENIEIPALASGQSFELAKPVEE
ncbi:MAG: DUF881 domain-containing protein [bacterium]|jgi:uncharacterized protein YlxW (UPF0749 family)